MLMLLSPIQGATNSRRPVRAVSHLCPALAGLARRQALLSSLVTAPSLRPCPSHQGPATAATTQRGEWRSRWRNATGRHGRARHWHLLARPLDRARLHHPPRVMTTMLTGSCQLSRCGRAPPPTNQLRAPVRQRHLSLRLPATTAVSGGTWTLTAPRRATATAFCSHRRRLRRLHNRPPRRWRPSMRCRRWTRLRRRCSRGARPRQQKMPVALQQLKSQL